MGGDFGKGGQTRSHVERNEQRACREAHVGIRRELCGGGWWAGAEELPGLWPWRFRHLERYVGLKHRSYQHTQDIQNLTPS